MLYTSLEYGKNVSGMGRNMMKSMEIKKRKNRFIAVLLVMLLVLQCIAPVAALADETLWYAFDASEIQYEPRRTAGEQIASGKTALYWHSNTFSDDRTYTLDTGCVVYPGDKISICEDSAGSATFGYKVNGEPYSPGQVIHANDNLENDQGFDTIVVADYPETETYAAGWIVTNLSMVSGNTSLIELSLLKSSDKKISYQIEKPYDAYAVFNNVGNPLYYSPNVGTEAFGNPSVAMSDELDDRTPYYGFLGWFEDENYSGNPITSIAAGSKDTDIVLYGLFAGRTNQNIVYKDDKGVVIPIDGTSNANGVSFTSSGDILSEYDEGEPVSLGAVTKENYDFTGWYWKKSGNFDTTADYTEENLLPNSLRSLREDVELYAGFKPKDIKFDIEYVLNGGTNSQNNPSQYNFGVGVASLEAPSRTGYDFDGWYAGEVKIATAPAISVTDTGKKTFTASWTPKTYTITYYDGESSLSGEALCGNPVSYTYGTGVTEFNNLEKTNYEFKGFYESINSETPITSIPADSTGDITLYARFSTVESNGGNGTNQPDPTENTIETYSYHFINNYSGLRYPDPYMISEDRFKEVFGDKGSFMEYFYNDEWGGSCYGLSTSSSLFNVSGNGINIADYDKGFEDTAQTVGDYNVRVDGAPSDINKDEVKKFIEQMQISQFDVRVQLCYIFNTGIADTINTLKTEIDAGRPMVIGIFGPEGGHAVLAYKFEEVPNTEEAKIHIYDSNWPNVDCYITAIKENGIYKYWYYDLMDVYNKPSQGYSNDPMLWGNYPGLITDKDRRDASDITYIPYDIYLTTYFDKGYYNNADWLIDEFDKEEWTDEDEEAYLNWVWTKADEYMYNKYPWTDTEEALYQGTNDGNTPSESNNRTNYRLKSRLKYRLRDMMGYSMETPMKTLVVGNAADYEIQDTNGNELASVENNELVLGSSANEKEIFQARNLSIMPSGSGKYSKAVVYLPADQAQRIVKDENADSLDVAVMNKDMVLSVSTVGDAVSMNVDAASRETSVELEGDGTVSILGQKGDTFEIKLTTGEAGAEKTSVIKGTVSGSDNGSEATAEQPTISIAGNVITGTGVEITENNGFVVKEETTNNQQSTEQPTNQPTNQPATQTCSHSNTVIRSRFEATCTSAGYSGDVYCADCGALISSGYSISTKGHTPLAAVKENVVEATKDKAASYDEVVYCRDCGKEISRKHETTKPTGKDEKDTDTEVVKPAPKKTVLTDATGAKYIVTKSKQGAAEVALKSTADVKKKTFTVPDVIEVDGVEYKVTSIAKNAFKGNKVIKNVVIGSNVISIGKKAFKNCAKLKKVIFKSSVETIGKEAFAGDAALKYIELTAPVGSIGEDALKGISKKATITINAGTKKAYKKLKKAVQNSGISKKVQFKRVDTTK